MRPERPQTHLKLFWGPIGLGSCCRPLEYMPIFLNWPLVVQSHWWESANRAWDSHGLCPDLISYRLSKMSKENTWNVHCTSAGRLNYLGKKSMLHSGMSRGSLGLFFFFFSSWHCVLYCNTPPYSVSSERLSHYAIRAHWLPAPLCQMTCRLGNTNCTSASRSLGLQATYSL